MPLLEVSELVKHFGSVRAVDGVTFTINEGETLALVGESGSGKTTLGRCVLRLIEPTAGEIRFDGCDLLSLRAAALRRVRQKVQIIFQDPFSSLNPRMSIGQAVAEPLIVHRACPSSEVPSRVAQLLSLVGLSQEHVNRPPHEFSGGQRQRVVIARALALNPKLIVADEPVSALDVSVQAQILNLLQDLQDSLGISYLFISHNLSVVRHVAHRTAIMYLGRIVEMGPTESLFNRPHHPYTQALISAVPVPDPTRVRQRLLLSGDVPSPRNLPSGCRFHPRCPRVMEQCRSEDPKLETRGEGLTAACHLLNLE